MVLLILLVISIVLQILAAGVAVRLIRTTKFNSSWILITIALVLMCVMRFNEFATVLSERTDGRTNMIVIEWEYYVWVGVATSLCFAVGVFLVRKILNYIALREEQRRNSEKRLLSAVIRAEENQRQIISKELHDGLGPLLSSVRMSVSALSTQQLSDTQKEILANTEYVINEAVKGLTEISNNLSPHVLNNFGVARALNTFIRKLQPMCPATRIAFDPGNMQQVRFDPDREVILYRVVCELINNALKHAGAGTLTIDMRTERDWVTVNVADDGRGFDPEAESDGMGLSNIASRISSIRGELQIDSRPGGGGTRVFIRIHTR
ncbi:ATP-binding protein [uncultured Rikenella sp.]|uniref:sensor histidine kinase n=1 Tax=uncultured Rikenella sp. TaxID=368003 RepID=UPI00261320F5|nr:ATP-binding protein [uncultured Rikenella sp.]